jgi:hypothetical protein
MWFEVPGLEINQRVLENGRDKKWKKTGKQNLCNCTLEVIVMKVGL